MKHNSSTPNELPDNAPSDLSSGVRSVKPPPQQLVEVGLQFVPQTLRYLGVTEGSVLDAAQDVFLIALRRLDDFEGRSSLTTWLFGICVRVAHGYRRRNVSSREALVEKLPEGASPPLQEVEAERNEDRRALIRLLDCLDEGQRAVFVLYEIQGLNMREVSDVLGCPQQTAYSRYRVARARILAAHSRSAAEKS